MTGRIEQALQDAAAKRGFSIRVRGVSPHEQRLWGIRNRITGFYARRDVPGDTFHLDVTNTHKWPTLAQVSDTVWMDTLMTELLERLDRHKAQREAYRAQCLAEHAAKEALRNSPEEKEKSRARKEKWRGEAAAATEAIESGNYIEDNVRARRPRRNYHDL